MQRFLLKLTMTCMLILAACKPDVDASMRTCQAKSDAKACHDACVGLYDTRPTSEDEQKRIREDFTYACRAACAMGDSESCRLGGR